MRSFFQFLLVPLSWILLGAVCNAEQAFWTGSVPPAPQARAAQVREWLLGFRQLDRQIPTLSPAERAWLKTEYDDQIASADGKFTPRALAATESTEYHKRIARQGIESVLSDLVVLSGSDGLANPKEILAWTRLAADMMDPPFWQSVTALRDRKVFAGEVNSVKDFFLDNHVMWARGVLDRVVIPMLSRVANR